ncbi:hypothetical protein [Enterococcus sp. DIV0086]|uniref:hypothetical protein n=1 Tax=Enterococcus sp. DIV0086 TaxID=2774655 RepID=UPI003D28FE01
MIDITGLNDSIHENMLAYEQNEVVKASHTTSSYGQTSVVVRKRRLTHQFRALAPILEIRTDCSL